MPLFVRRCVSYRRECQILRQLDIATSKTIAIEVVSGVGKVVDDTTPVSLWALGDQLLIRVWQEKVNPSPGFGKGALSNRGRWRRVYQYYYNA